jgi:hypothetical protein
MWKTYEGYGDYYNDHSQSYFYHVFSLYSLQLSLKEFYGLAYGKISKCFLETTSKIAIF